VDKNLNHHLHRAGSYVPRWDTRPSTPSHLGTKQQGSMEGGTGIREQSKMGC